MANPNLTRRVRGLSNPNTNQPTSSSPIPALSLTRTFLHMEFLSGAVPRGVNKDKSELGRTPPVSQTRHCIWLQEDRITALYSLWRGGNSVNFMLDMAEGKYSDKNTASCRGMCSDNTILYPAEGKYSDKTIRHLGNAVTTLHCAWQKGNAMSRWLVSSGLIYACFVFSLLYVFLTA